MAFAFHALRQGSPIAVALMSAIGPHEAFFPNDTADDKGPKVRGNTRSKWRASRLVHPTLILAGRGPDCAKPIPNQERRRPRDPRRN